MKRYVDLSFSWLVLNAMSSRRRNPAKPTTPLAGSSRAPTTIVDLTDDASFDELLSSGLRPKATLHFTPVDVARRAAEFLAPFPGMTVLDVGAGAGKFCLTAARAAPRARFVGVEWRPHLVREAKRLARAYQLPNVFFIEANAFDLDWSAYDSFYLYNPFAEQLLDSSLVIDRTVCLDPMNFPAYVSSVGLRLAEVPEGTRVVTYHGFGGSLPRGYSLSWRERAGTDVLELWIKLES